MASGVSSYSMLWYPSTSSLAPPTHHAAAYAAGAGMRSAFRPVNASQRATITSQ